MAGYVHRIGQLLETLAAMETDSEEKTTEDEDSLGAENLASHGSDTIFKLINVSFAPPNCPDPLVKDLDLEISHGKNILITGNAGSGKSSLFRILCGLWSPLSGEVLRFLPHNPKAIFFLPQKTFLTDGTLRQQLTYPYDDPSRGDISDRCTGGSENEKLIELLDIVGLKTLNFRVGGLDKPVDSNWEDLLSPGEMQRLSFARLFFHRPLLALLDEATSALDVAWEIRLYSACKELGITVVSVGHRKSLREVCNSCDSYTLCPYVLTLCWRFQCFYPMTSLYRDPCSFFDWSVFICEFCIELHCASLLRIIEMIVFF